MLAFQAPQFLAEESRAAFFRENPWAQGPGWIMAHMLSVTAFQIGNPVLVLVLVKSDDAAEH